MSAPVQDLFYDELVSSYVDSGIYLERDWLVQRVRGRLNQPQTRFVLITGQPGAGKSSFAAGLARDNKRWLRYFIRRDQRAPLGGTGARAFLLQIGLQFAALYPEAFRRPYLEMRVRNRIGRIVEGGRLVGAQIDRVIASPFFQTVVDISTQVQENQGQVINLQIDQLITDPYLLPVEELAYLGLVDPAVKLLELHPDTQLVILVDALDELRYRPESSGLLEWLASCPDLPPNCKFVLTSRPDHDLLAHLRLRGDELAELEIASGDILVQQDATDYARFLVEIEAVQSVMDSPQAIDAFVEQTVRKADGNLGYLDAYRRAITHAAGSGDRARLSRLLNYSALPAGLSGLYAYLLSLVRQSVERTSVEVVDGQTGERHYLRAWPAVYHRILSILAVAFEPLSADQIDLMGSIIASRADILEALADLAQLLDGQGPYRLYHASLAEFLRDPESADGPDAAIFAVDAPTWHVQIVRALIRAYQGRWSECDTYGLDYLLQHLLEAELTQAECARLLDKILTEPFVQARGERFGWHRPLIQDLSRLKDVAPLQVMQTGLNIVTGKHRNSLANQEVLRLLVEVYASLSPDLKLTASPKEGTTHRTVYELVAALEQPAETALATITPYLDPEKALDVRIKGVVVLAVAETRAPEARNILEDVLFHPGEFVKRKRDRAHVRWCAADGLLALKDPSTARDLQAAFWEPRAKPWEQHVILYVLGRMKADLPVAELRRMIDVGMQNPQPFMPRVVDAIQLLAPKSGPDRQEWISHYQNQLLAGLGLAGPADRVPWVHVLLIKRTIVALGRIGTADVIGPLQAYLEGMPAMEIPQEKKDNLLKAGRRALDQLNNRYRVPESGPN